MTEEAPSTGDGYASGDGAASGDAFRETYSKAADRLAAKSIKALEDALDSEKTYYQRCPKCQHGFRAAFPDFNARAKAVEIIRDTGKGKPGQQKAPVEKPKTGRKIEELSDEELFAIVQGVDNGKA